MLIAVLVLLIIFIILVMFSGNKPKPSKPIDVASTVTQKTALPLITPATSSPVEPVPIVMAGQSVHIPIFVDPIAKTASLRAKPGNIQFKFINDTLPFMTTVYTIPLGNTIWLCGLGYAYYTKEAAVKSQCGPDASVLWIG